MIFILIKNVHEGLYKFPPKFRTFIYKLSKPFLFVYFNYWADAFLISFPKCGQTWVRVLLGKSFTEHFKLNLEYKELLETDKLSTYNSEIPRIRVIHDNDAYLKKAKQLRKDKSRYRNKKVIFLCRDPRDVIVSLFFHKKYRVPSPELAYKKGLKSFVYEERGSTKTLMKYYHIWMENSKLLNNFLMIRYEDLQANTKKELKKILDFLDLKFISEDTIDKAVEFASFKNMRNLEEQKKYDPKKHLSPFIKGDIRSYKTRQGKVGGYLEYLEETEIKYIESFFSDEFIKFFGYKKRYNL